MGKFKCKKLLVLKVNVQFHDFHQIIRLLYIYKHTNAVSSFIFFLNHRQPDIQMADLVVEFSLNNQPNSRPELLTAQ